MCRRAQKAETELRKTSIDLHHRERGERDAAESRAHAAQAESEKGAALAAAKRVSYYYLTPGVLARGCS